MNNNIKEYNKRLSERDQAICDLLATQINKALPAKESKIWHGHPVWFLDGNPIAGYSYMKTDDCIRLMFWSGADFDEPKLEQTTGKFKDAVINYTSVDQVNTRDLERWLKKSRVIQWDYKNIVKRKGKLIRLK